MPAFTSPLASPDTWTCEIAPPLTLPSGLRYSGYTVRGIRATHAPAEAVRVPALGILRKVTQAGQTVVEVQVNPFPIRTLVAQLPWGVPTFYFVFADETGLTFENGFTAAGDETLRTATDVTVAMVGQDRVVIDPALWASQIAGAIATTGGDNSQWQPFVDRVNSQLNSGPTAPVLLLDATGQPLRSGEVDLVFGTGGAEVVHRATLVEGDRGDLQRTVARLHAADPAAMPIANLWSTVSSFRLRPVVPGGGGSSAPAAAFQLARLEDSLTAAGELAVTPAERHILLTHLHDWFAPQFAIPVGAAEPAMARFTRNNRLTPLVNGPTFFDDLFRQLYAARTPGGGFHLAGWAMFPEQEFTQKREGDPEDLPLTLRQAAEQIGAAGGACRFLPARFVQLASGSSSIPPIEALAFHLLIDAILILNAFNVSFARTDAAGVVVLFALWIAATAFTAVVIDEDGQPLEPNKDAVEVLGAIANSISHYAPYPARVEDNTAAPSLSGFPFDTLFTVIRHFGIYHQKFAIVRTDTSHIAYCGGIDLNPDRLDDLNHLIKSPYHDVHTRVEGPAVHDLALSFEERWNRDGAGSSLAFAAPDRASLGTPGTDIVQVARTYFAAADPSRRLDFAPNGDRTIADTMLRAIAAAREFIYVEDQYLTPPQAYRDALVDKVTSGEIQSLIITVPGINDQPFGELVRSSFVNALRTADAGRGIVQVGYPRRHFTVPDNDLRASSGKCLLGEALPASSGINPTIVLGPKDRLPAPPFWVAVDGELIWVYDEASTPAPNATTRRFAIDRGDDTRLVNGGSTPRGAKTREHKQGAAATVVDLTGIYVHAKMMIVDDIFLGVGSANLNRRGLFHDGEINVFTMPQGMKASRDNPVAALRMQLWAEMLNLPQEMAAPLLRDPLAAARLFQRNPFNGNRYTPIEALPFHTMLGLTSSDALFGNLLQGLGFTITAANHTQIFDGVVDPSSATEAAL